ncbi:hypothetical protein CVD28_02540 [Bacillus sp. M6-12]|uniref:hypothetical protein n=1 Tax=Bacillus sp. M6-12 TaxID=2054166 RepID=UPI000C77A900|nr:hypothetical protein [Bacillus sp. M6-12]PLS19310.1 hypothetical protein CVD28_02540 [Bacillus sp. M6-12]
MEITISIVLSIFYGLSIWNLGFRFLMLGACHGDPKGVIMARQNFIVAVVFFLLMSAGMMVRFSIWFGVPVILFFVIPLIIYLYDEIRCQISYKKKKSREA